MKLTYTLILTLVFISPFCVTDSPLLTTDSLFTVIWTGFAVGLYDQIKTTVNSYRKPKHQTYPSGR